MIEVRPAHILGIYEHSPADELTTIIHNDHIDTITQKVT